MAKRQTPSKQSSESEFLLFFASCLKVFNTSAKIYNWRRILGFWRKMAIEIQSLPISNCFSAIFISSLSNERYLRLMKRKWIWETLIVALVIGATAVVFKELFSNEQAVTVALVMLMEICLFGIIFGIIPVISGAIGSALIWNYYFIPPTHTFQIKNTRDLFTFLLYFFIALLSSVLAFRIRKARERAADRDAKAKSLALYNTVFNSLSHELKTPLSAILSSTDLLKTHLDKLSPEAKVEVINELESGAHRLKIQLENLLQMSRINSGMMNLKLDWVDLEEIIQQCASTLNVKIQLTTKSKTILKADAGLLSAIFNNLFSNAANYAGNESIELKISRDSQHLFIRISDKGPGIPEEYHQQIFESFFRLPNSKPGGTGLGLSICKGIVEAHNGKIELIPAEIGAVFLIQLPHHADES